MGYNYYGMDDKIPYQSNQEGFEERREGEEEEEEEEYGDTVAENREAYRNEGFIDSVDGDYVLENVELSINKGNVDMKQKEYFINNLKSDCRLANITALVDLSSSPEFITPIEFEKGVCQILFAAFGRKDGFVSFQPLFPDLAKEQETGRVVIGDLLPSEITKSVDSMVEEANSELFSVNYKLIALWKLADMVDNIIAGKCLYEWDESVLSPVSAPNTSNCIIRIILPLLFHAFCHGGRKIANAVACVASSIANSFAQATWMKNPESNAILIAEHLGFKLISISAGLRMESNIVRTFSKRIMSRDTDDVIGFGRNSNSQLGNPENGSFGQGYQSPGFDTCIERVGCPVAESYSGDPRSVNNVNSYTGGIDDIDAGSPVGAAGGPPTGLEDPEKNYKMYGSLYDGIYDTGDICLEDSFQSEPSNDFNTLQREDVDFSLIEPASLLLTGLIPSLPSDYTTRRILPILARIASSRPIHQDMLVPSISVGSEFEMMYLEEEDEECLEESGGIDSSLGEEEMGEKNRRFYLGPSDKGLNEEEFQQNYLHILEDPSAKSFESGNFIDDVIEQKHAIGTLAAAVALVSSTVAHYFIVPLLEKLISNNNSGIRKASINIIPSCSTTLDVKGRLNLGGLINRTIGNDKLDVRERAVEAIIPFLETLTLPEIQDLNYQTTKTHNDLDNKSFFTIGSNEDVQQLFSYMALSVASKEQILDIKDNILWDPNFSSAHNDGQLEMYELLRDDDIINRALVRVPNSKRPRTSHICAELFANSIDKLFALLAKIFELHTSSEITNVNLSSFQKRQEAKANSGCLDQQGDETDVLGMYCLLVRLLMVVLRLHYDLNMTIYDRIHLFINKLPYPMIGGIYNFMIDQVYERFKYDSMSGDPNGNCLFNNYDFTIRSILTAIPRVVRLFNVNPRYHQLEKRNMTKSTRIATDIKYCGDSYTREPRVTYGADFFNSLEVLREDANWRGRYALAKCFILIKNVSGNKEPHSLLRIFGIPRTVDSEEERLQAALLDLVVQLFNDEIFSVRKRAFKSAAAVILDKYKYRTVLVEETNIEVVEKDNTTDSNPTPKPTETTTDECDDTTTMIDNCEEETEGREEFSYTLTVESICFLCYYFIKFGCCQLRDVAIDIITRTDIGKCIYGCVLKILELLSNIVREETRLFNHGILNDTPRINEMRNSPSFKRFLLFCSRIDSLSIIRAVTNITESLGI